MIPQMILLKKNVPDPLLLEALLAESAERHRHLCPRQVLGIRMGLYGLRLLGFVAENYAPKFHNKRKQLLTIMEMDGCGADGVSVATNCWVGRRTLRVEDYGKMAATFVRVATGEAVRVAPSTQARHLATIYEPDAPSRWHAYLEAYKKMPDEELLVARHVALKQPIESIISRAGVRAICEDCGEEIMNEREVAVNGRILCLACAGEGGYYWP